MKLIRKIIIYGAILSLPVLAQDFELLFNDTTVNVAPGPQVIVIDGLLVNTTGDSIDVRMKRMQVNLPQNWTNSLCLINCAAPFIDSIDARIAPGDSIFTSVDFQVLDNVPATGTALVEFKSLVSGQVVRHLFTGSTEVTGISDNGVRQPKGFQLFANYPNPFNNQTVISAYLPQDGDVKVQIYDILGKTVYNFTGQASAGVFRLQWPGLNFNNQPLSSGIYFYRVALITNGSIVESRLRKLTLLR